MLIPQTEVIITVDGAELGRCVVTPGEYVLGREGEIAVDADLVSRRHALLTVNYGDWLIEDLGSTNGTQLNGEPVSGATRVWPSQKIQLGTATIELHRLQTEPEEGQSLGPQAASVRRYLPPEFLRGSKYAIEHPIAQGGMGAILAAQEVGLHRPVAMKVMLASGDESDLVRFIEEAQIAGQLQHPNIVPVYELGVDEHDQVFYTMKLVEGITLKKVLELLRAEIPATVEKYPLNTLLTIFLKVCDALTYSHAKRVIHRDLKPENLMLGSFGEVLVMDWGLAKVLGKSEATARTSARLRSVVLSSRNTGAASTLAGTIMGTPHFMSPEQAAGKIELLDVRSDIFSLGAILYQILTLDVPFQGRTVDEVLAKVCCCQPMPPAQAAILRATLDRAKSKPEVPSALAAVAMKALSLRPEDRYQSVAELQREIEAYQGGFATEAEKAGAWKQAALFIRRNKTASIGVAAVLLIGGTLGAKAIIEGRRAEREAVRANRALDDLKRTAPALRQLAESEASFQRFDSALEKLDAALALNPADLPSYWRRAWLFIGMDQLAEAAAAVRIAQQKDPAHSELAAILPAIEKLAPLPASERWRTDAGRDLWKRLAKVGASGETVALSAKLNPDIKDKINLVRQRMDEWLGKGKGGVSAEQGGVLQVSIYSPVDSIEPLRGLPIDTLIINQTLVGSLEPLRGMHLVSLQIGKTKVTDLSPLIGMPLHELRLSENKGVDLSPLRRLPLELIHCPGGGQTDLSALRGLPLKDVDIGRNAVRDLDFLSDAPLVTLDARSNHITDLSPLRGKPIKRLILSANNVSDLSPLRGTPIEELKIDGNPVKDLTPLLNLSKLERLSVSRLGKLLQPLHTHPSLKFIAYDNEPYRPAADFWKEYDAMKAAVPK